MVHHTSSSGRGTKPGGCTRIGASAPSRVAQPARLGGAARREREHRGEQGARAADVGDGLGALRRQAQRDVVLPRGAHEPAQRGRELARHRDAGGQVHQEQPRVGGLRRSSSLSARSAFSAPGIPRRAARHRHRQHGDVARRDETAGRRAGRGEQAPPAADRPPSRSHSPRTPPSGPRAEQGVEARHRCCGADGSRTVLPRPLARGVNCPDTSSRTTATPREAASRPMLSASRARWSAGPRTANSGLLSSATAACGSKATRRPAWSSPM